MTREQINLVRHSIASLHSNPDLVAMRFYARLFAPGLRLPCSSDVPKLAQKIAAVLAFVVKELGKPEGVFPYIVKLGARHSDCLIDSRQFVAVEEALLWVLEQELGSNFTPEVREAWQAVYRVFAQMAIAVSQKMAAAA